ncbi:unnamed protein product [Paramecium octaurelia]|uniref:Uncharacterized protein n=1 Tax=Paramecium octaurelia TaxID=43137 RepID=A0A8S1XTC2_PAROT|nr:unnamed protein product [Paramecium octaurelia]
MSLFACFEDFPPGPVLVSEGQRQAQNEDDDMRKVNDKPKGTVVRFWDEAPINLVEPSCSEEDVELNCEYFDKKFFSNISVQMVSIIFIYLLQYQMMLFILGHIIIKRQYDEQCLNLTSVNQYQL